MKFGWLDFKITNRCNNHCLYCSGRHESPAAPERISAKVLCQTVQDAKDIGFTHFAFLGGEPSLRDDFPLIMQPLQIGDQVESVMVISNMLLFNENVYRTVFQTNARHAQVVASIDNLQEPNFKHQNVIQTLEYIARIENIAKEYRAKGVRDVHVHSVISRENLHQLISHIQFFASRNIDVSMAIVEPFKLVRSAELCTQYNYFTSAEIHEIIDQMDVLEKMGLLNWANNLMREYLTAILANTMDRYAECTAGTSHVVIDSDGSVYPCLTEAYRKGLEFGNISKTSFRNVYRRMDRFHCGSTFQQTCWDHLLWTRLEKLTAEKTDGKSN
jgi:MoaA/NifB/PqqE/SkfB family radical SAM enzyme